MSAREDVLARVRAALDGTTAPTVPRDYERAPLSGPADVDLFTRRVEDYAARVHRVPGDAAAAALVASLVGDQRVVVPHDLPEHLRGAVPDASVDRPDAPLTTRELDEHTAVVTTAALGIALTGTVVLDAGAGQGRRAVTLVPDHHVCVLTADRLVDTVPQAFAALDPVRPTTLVSGPSATSDIELERVEGVHGPRRLDVVLVAPSVTEGDPA